MCKYSGRSIILLTKAIDFLGPQSSEYIGDVHQTKIIILGTKGQHGNRR